MESCRDADRMPVAFSSDTEEIYKTFETILASLDCDGLPLKVGRAIRTKLKTEQSTFRGSTTRYLSDSLKQLGFPKSETSRELESLRKYIQKIFSKPKSAEQLISIIIGIEENLNITRDLLKSWVLEAVKKRNGYTYYRNSNLKLFFDLNQNLSSLRDLKDLETEDSLSDANEITTELTHLFYKWWKMYCSMDIIENALENTLEESIR